MSYALALGSADSLFKDLETCLNYLQVDPTVIVAANDAGWKVPLVDHWATLHPEKFPEWVEKRADIDGTAYARPMLWTTSSAMKGTHGLVTVLGEQFGYDAPTELEGLWGPRSDSGSSGMLAVQVALLFAPRVILCGMPIDERPRFEGALSKTPFEPDNFREPWKKLKETHGEKIRSMSGWTRQLFHLPTEEWASTPDDQ